MRPPSDEPQGPPLPARAGTAASPAAGSPSTSTSATEYASADDRRLVLSDVLNRVLDRGLLITGTVTLAVADIDLVRLDLNLVLTAVETAMRRSTDRGGA